MRKGQFSGFEVANSGKGGQCKKKKSMPHQLRFCFITTIYTPPSDALPSPSRQSMLKDSPYEQPLSRNIMALYLLTLLSGKRKR